MNDHLRSYGYGTALLISGFGGQIKRITALGATMDEGKPAGVGVDQYGNSVWFLDTQIVRVLE